MTRTRGAWWCRYRGHCRSGPRHFSPRSRVCAQEWHCKDIHSHIHSHTPMHTLKIRPKKHPKNTQPKQNTQLTKHDAFDYCSSSCPVCWWATFRKLGTCCTSEALSPRTVLIENICESVQVIHQDSPEQTKSSTDQTWCLCFLVLFNVAVGDGREAWQILLRPVPRRRTSRLGQYWQKTFVDVFNT